MAKKKARRKSKSKTKTRMCYCGVRVEQVLRKKNPELQEDNDPLAVLIREEEEACSVSL